MPSSSGPKISSKESLVFAIDTYDTSNCVTPLGCGGFNNSTQGIKNILTGTTSLFQNGLKISNRDFYTAFAIDYPEGSYGGDAANRQGITPGYNVRSGGKIFGYGRALHHSIWDNNSQSWVVHNIYDTYAYSSAVDDFVNNYYSYIALYPNAVHVVAGSHRDSNHNSNQYTILRDLGAPSNVDSIIGFSSPEWILVGKPGLGAGNAYGWVFQNYPTNPDQVAHMNFSVTPKALGVLDFDGSDDLLNTGSTPSSLQGNPNLTICGFFKRKSDQSYGGPWGIGGEATDQGINCWNYYATNEIAIDTWNRSTFTSGVTFPLNEWVFAAWQKYAGPMTRANCIIWRNLSSYTGNQLTVLRSEGPSPNINNLGITLGSISTSTGYCKNFEISKFQIYNTVLSTSEITQIYNQNKKRFNLS
jgi:hypothetical protein